MVYLEADESDQCSSPSSCVRLVREFLEFELESNSNCKFTVDVTGPSPFHADFIVETMPEQRNPIIWARIAQRAYDEVAITVPDEIESFDELIFHLSEHLLDDFDVFYGIVIQRSKIMYAWGACLSAVEEYEMKRRSWGALRRAASVFLSGLQTHDLVSKIAEFRLAVMTAMEAINDRISGNVFLKISPIWVDIRKERKTFPKYDIDSLEKLVDFIERKQSHSQDIANTLFAAIAGGAAGALVTWLMK